MTWSAPCIGIQKQKISESFIRVIFLPTSESHARLGAKGRLRSRRTIRVSPQPPCRHTSPPLRPPRSWRRRLRRRRRRRRRGRGRAPSRGGGTPCSRCVSSDAGDSDAGQRLVHGISGVKRLGYRRGGEVTGDSDAGRRLVHGASECAWRAAESCHPSRPAGGAGASYPSHDIRVTVRRLGPGCVAQRRRAGVAGVAAPSAYPSHARRLGRRLGWGMSLAGCLARREACYVPARHRAARIRAAWRRVPRQPRGVQRACETSLRPDTRRLATGAYAPLGDGCLASREASWLPPPSLILTRIRAART